MWGLAQRLIAALATFGSFIALLVSFKQPGQPLTAWQYFFTALSLLAFGLTVIFEIHDYIRSKPKVMRSEKKVRQYMHKWIENGARVAVFSRSLGWVEQDTYEMLKKKAESGDLTLVMPTEAGRSADLAGHGARVLYYGSEDYVIRSRFTIVNRGRTDTAVAIGRQNAKGQHIVTEYKARDDDPSYWLAEDMIELLLRRPGSSSQGDSGP